MGTYSCLTCFTSLPSFCPVHWDPAPAWEPRRSFWLLALDLLSFYHCVHLGEWTSWWKILPRKKGYLDLCSFILNASVKWSILTYNLGNFEGVPKKLEKKPGGMWCWRNQSKRALKKDWADPWNVKLWSCRKHWFYPFVSNVSFFHFSHFLTSLFQSPVLKEENI